MRFFRIPLTLLSVVGAFGAAGAHAQDITVNLAQADQNIGALFTQYFNFAFLLAGVLAFGAIVYGGFQYMISAGNPSGQSDARDRVLQAIIGLLLLVGSGLILRTINIGVYDSSTGMLYFPIATTTILKAPNPPSGGVGPPAAGCSNLAEMAAKMQVPYPTKTDQDVQKIINCVLDKVKGKNISLGSIFTVDISNPSCNYTRGNPVCTPGKGCSHSAYSCHYGGRTGTSGSLAVDFGMGAGDTNPQDAQTVTNAVKSCDGSARVYSILNDPVGHRDHIHVSLGKCDSN